MQNRYKFGSTYLDQKQRWIQFGFLQSRGTSTGILLFLRPIVHFFFVLKGQ